MKKSVIFLMIIILIPSCVLLPESTSTPFPPLNTEIAGTLNPTTTIEKTKQAPTASSTYHSTKTANPTQLPTDTATPHFTSTPFPVKLQPGSPAYIRNFGHLSEGCEWSGVAGQVFGTDGKPLLNHVVSVLGKLNGNTFEKVGVTGVPEADIYGPGGFEIIISDSVFVSENIFTIQIFDLNGDPISEAVSFNTYANCEKNLVIINFQY